MKEYFIPESMTNTILSVSDDYKRFICPKSAVYFPLRSSGTSARASC